MRTKALLLGGAVAGPLFIMVGLGQALLRDGFDLGHNTLSLLSNGAFGWVQVLNFSPDPAFGFPPGTAAGPPTTTSWHGGLHYTFASLAFVALLGAFVALARRHARHGHRGWAAATWTIAVAMTAATVLISTAAERAPVNVFYVATTLLAFLWASVLLAQLLAAGTRPTATVPQRVTWR
jgi:hypothetical protein